nr:formate dehydrogenase accessory sulfurtransferase FdhD [Lewinella sp. 4G2]
MRIHRFRGPVRQKVDDHLAVESPLQIQLQGTRGSAPKSVAITMRTPGQDHDLALGFLFSEGILSEPAEVVSVAHRDAKSESGRNTIVVKTAPGVIIDWQRLERHGYTTSSCGVCGKTSLEQVHAALPFPETLLKWQLDAAVISTAPDVLREAQKSFARTGGIHGVGLFSLTGELLHHAEDVGRHNAMDKVLGWAFREARLPLEDHFVVLSGRASFELVQKAAMAGIRCVVAVGAPSSLAVELAEDQSMTLCGFVKPGGFNCYCGSERITENTG